MPKLMRPLTAGLLLAIAASAQAQPEGDSWHLGASLGLTQLKNLYRTSNAAAANDDQLRTATLLAGSQLRLGRQRLRADARVSQNDYRRNPDLGYVGYAGGAGLDWVLGSQLSGSLSANAQRNLAPFNPGNAPITQDKNIENNRQLRAALRYGLRGQWSVDAALTAVKRDFSISLYEPYNYTQNSAQAGLRWQPDASLWARIGLRSAEGDYPRFRKRPDGSYEADRFTRNEIETSVDWQLAARHVLAVRLNYGKSDHTGANARDYQGGSGRLSWQWQPGSRLQMLTTLRREQGDDSRDIDLGLFGSISSLDSRVYDSLQWQAAYAISSKLSVNVSASELRRELSSSFGNLTRGGTDRTRTASVGVSWAFDQRGQLGCQWATDRRRGAAGFSLPYTASSVGCSVQYQIGG